jgi:hypothetical protein
VREPFCPEAGAYDTHAREQAHHHHQSHRVIDS